MPLIDDPSVTQPLLTPRGYIPLAGSDEEINPAQPLPEPKPVDNSKTLEQIRSYSNNPLLAPSGIIGAFFGTDLGQAALRENNTIASGIARITETFGVSNDLTDPNYSPWEDVAGTPYEKYWKDTFVHSNNRAYTEALKRTIDRQEEDRRTVAAGGTLGAVAGMVAGTIDPTLLLPVGGEITLASKGVWNIARGALAGARAGGLGATAYELGLHASQETRTLEESALNIGTGVVLGAVLGGTIASALSRTQRVASEEALERIANMPVPDSLGAAASHKFSIDDLTINGKITNNIAAATAFSPNLRGNFRESPLARQTYQEVATNVLRQGMHEVGLSLGPSVETNINVALGETIGQALLKHPVIFAESKKAAGVVKLSFDQFDQEVGRAMRRADDHPNEFVAKAAKMWRSQVIDPLTDQAINLNMLPEDVSVSEAPSYFSRLYNRDKMVAQKPVFIQIAQDHYHGLLQENYVREHAVLRTRQEDLARETDVLKLSPKRRAKKLAELKALKDDANAQKIVERVENADDEAIKARLEEIEQQRKKLERDFLDKWEIRRLGENVDTANPETIPDFSIHARDMANDTYDSIVGNDYGSASVEPQFHLAAKSGPLKDRTFHIPDEKIEDFLEDNVTTVMSRFARTMAAQIELERKFPGDPLLRERFKQIKDQYDVLMDAAKTEKERQKLQKDMKGTFRDLRALLEIHRGSYMAKENASSWGRVVRGTMLFNYIRSMGGSVLPSISDIYGPAIFHGLGQTMEVGIPALAKAVSKQGQLVKEAQWAGLAERLGHHRLLTLTEIGDPYANGTAIERLLENGSRVASTWNGLNMLTDFQKAFDAIVVQHRLNQGILKGKDTEWIAQSGMGPDMRAKVLKQLEQHVTEEDGISVANTDQWDDWDAVRAYRAAINFNVNADIVTRGIGDVPLAAYHPLGKLFLQFKTFNLAAHQRTFLRASQLGPAQFLSGLIGLTTIGMFSAYLRALRGGKESFDRFNKAIENRGYWVGEGLDATGFFTLPIELSNVAERATERAGYKVNPVKTPLMLAGRIINPDSSLQGQSLSRPGQRTLAEALGGPSLALLEDIPVGAGGTAVDILQGEEQSKAHERALNRIIPYQSYLGMRELLQVIEGNSPYIDGQNE